jgi:hypothetical protein
MKLGVNGNGTGAACVRRLNIELSGTLEARGRYASLQGQSLFITTDMKAEQPPSGCWLTLKPDPATPRLLCKKVPGAWDVAVMGKHAVVCDYTCFLMAYKMTETEWNPVAKLPMPSMTENMIVRSNRAYVANHTAGLTVVDVSNPGNPSILANFDPSIDCDGIDLWNDVAILYGHWESRLVLVDVSNPAKPREIGVYQHDPRTFIQAAGVAADEGIAYAVAGTHGLVTVNIADPTAPKLVKVVDMKGPAMAVRVTDGFAFAAVGQSGVHVLDVKNPAKPVEVGFYRDATELEATQLVVVRGTRRTPAEYFVYVANAKGQAVVLRFRPPA